MRPALFALLALLTGSALIGWLIDAPALCLALGWLLYGLIQLWQLARLQRWLIRPSMQTLPHAKRLWGDLFDTLHRLLRREQKERERFGRIIERIETATAALQDALLILDSQGQLSWWNPAAESLLGLKSRQDSGQLLCNLIRHPDFRAWLMQPETSDVLALPSPLNEQNTLQFHKTQYGDGETLLLVRDITRVKQLEQMRKDFVDNLSHELRTPLTVISGYLEILQYSADALPAPSKKALLQMQTQAVRMQRLLEDLLHLAELEGSAPAACEPVDVAALLSSIVTDTRVLADARDLRIQLEAHPALQLLGCAEELRSAFANLIVNAVKYSPNGTQIQIRWWSDQQGAHFAVQDQGSGIEEKHLPRLTERFYRVDKSRESTSGGSGLGLAIVKHVLLRHGGQLQIQSKPGEGSTFSCHFPLTPFPAGERGK
ncbi:hypothetical protein AXE65_01400 [Ventosimonas gracilis]|uniref:Phosphate regulon sensor protein PhoR n=1 Tax=Ventosimonas gracilis TaxID=1680762 RepID=A0A139SUV9_9GAMM|nr:phosphate regulon sensor histidine kinase PhoR [Ventosimonas gracilis]KXU38398.1 hypothetical protein AXE65_01400 [Ventosimonas gracilis]